MIENYDSVDVFVGVDVGNVEHHAVALNRTGKGSMSSWWINLWDRHAAVIFDKSTGPFLDCDPAEGHLHRRKDKFPTIIFSTKPPDNVEL
ncbi:protein of unknown function [Cryobacterium luteum]|nr:protein of unknown function [Cryobacterium luteum]